MKRTSPKRASHKKKVKKTNPKVSAEENCAHCEKDLTGSDRALYVEEEVGRTFCTEDCIASYFSPDIQRLEKEYFKHLPKDDLDGEEREKHAQLRWTTLQEPQEIWREKTLAGDYRYALISEYKLKGRNIWSVCICLLLRGEPSFLFIAIITRKESLVDRYRRGDRVQRVRRAPEKPESTRETIHTLHPEMESEGNPEVSSEGEGASEPPAPPTDGLAEPWTEDEVLRAERIKSLSEDDIPVEQYKEYEKCVEPTLEKPDEIWSWEEREAASPEGEPAKKSAQGHAKHYHFIKKFEEESPPLWYVIVARETEQDDQLEIMDLFPTRNIELLDRYRRGEQELGESVQEPVFSRLVH